MAPLTSKERDHLAEKLQHALQETSFACFSLTPLAGGTTSFVFRGELVKPFSLERGQLAKTVIIKHATNFASCNQDFKLDDSRAEFEITMLHALERSPLQNTIGPFSVKIPRSLFFDMGARLQVMEDIIDSIELAKFIAAPKSHSAQISLNSIGFAIGSWVREFHDWTSAPAQAGLRQSISRNQEMRKLKRGITYDNVIEILEKFPSVLGSHREELQKIQDKMTQEFETELSECNEDSEEWGIIHGDFWTGNVLFSNPHMNASVSEAHLYIIDWEFAQIGHRSIDLGQMIGDLLETNHFSPSSYIMDFIDDLIGGYGVVSEEMGFRIAIHVGVHMINWYSRHPMPHGSASHDVESLMGNAIELVIRGWNKDKLWFGGSVLRPLFSNIASVEQR